MPMYQLLLRLRARRDCAWERQYHRKVRGRLAQAVAGTTADSHTGTDRSPFAFSDLMPAGSQPPGRPLDAGDEVHLLVSSGDVDVLRAIAADLDRDSEVTAGSFVFETRAARPLRTGAGPPGTTGTITTASGIVLTLAPEHDSERATPEYWTDRDHSVAEFRAGLHDTLGRILEREAGIDPPGDELFDGYDHRKTYAVDVAVTARQTVTLLASKWDLDYEVRDEAHRQALNAVLAHGAGAKRSYGFGMLQTRSDAAILDAATAAGEAV